MTTEGEFRTEDTEGTEVFGVDLKIRFVTICRDVMRSRMPNRVPTSASHEQKNSVSSVRASRSSPLFTKSLGGEPRSLGLGSLTEWDLRVETRRADRQT
jgi:hypothetical protein